jgi:D-alanyl-D-alanine endopeptidase (penicillin-binding protein 7)
MTETMPTQPEGELLLAPAREEPPRDRPIEAESASRLPEPVPSRKHTLLTIAAFALVFVLGGTLTFSYLTHVPRLLSPGSKQTAAVAAIVPDAFASVKLQAQSAYVYDLATREVLYTLDPDAIRPLASLTKIAMALAVSEVLPPDSTIPIPYDTAPAGDPEVLTKGSVWPVRDVIDFTLIASSNQGADILAAAANGAIHAKYPQSPAVGATVWRMNDIAQSLGLAGMVFSNDNGLDLSATESGAYGSARDVGTLVAYAASTSLPVFAATTKSDMTFRNAAGQTATAYNTDTALGAIPGIIMGKTGYTDLAGGNLAVVFDAGIGHPVVAVVMGSTEDGRFSDMKQLVDATISAVNQGQ